MKNLFCDKKDLINESSVEQFFIIRLLDKLGYKDAYIETKNNLPHYQIYKGSRRKSYCPDYILYLDKGHKKPVTLIDAKHPKKPAEEGVEDAQQYSSVLRRKLRGLKPEQYCIGTNGIKFVLKHYDSDTVLLTLNFNDFQEKNSKYQKLIKDYSYNKLKENYSDGVVPKEKFEFIRPETREIEGIFKACHNLIWKKEKVKPTEAFFEFSKIFFVKLFYDREIHKLIKQGKELTPKDCIFSVSWINEQEKWETNPFNTILFKNLRNDMEKEIKKKQKKRIFEKDEQINLKPSTIKEVVRLLEHLDLFGVDEDLNGRMFETFLTATVRGKDLGQFFTPRSVVKFMVEMADLTVKKEEMDAVLDGLCGSGGFLIETMANMFEKVKNMGSLSNIEKEKLKNEIVTKKIWGVDANKNITRVARMNMYLHGDGSNMIFWLPDFLDKNIEIEKGTQEELKEEAEEFKKKILKEEVKFNVVLTNPPFSMRYEQKNADEKKILEEYEIAYKDGKLRSSLKSNVLSIERYKDLLKPHGKLITIIDESVLNTDTEKDFRDFIKKHFLVRAIISLPRNTFVNAETNVKTSILYLVKKAKKDEEQPKVFMAIADSVGHTDAGKPKPELNTLLEILKNFKEFENG